MGLLILVLLLCCRRRRRRSRAGSSRAFTPGEDEINNWRSPRHHHGHKSEKALLTGGVVAVDHHANRNNHGRMHENPFTPVPPPPRRSAPNSRSGLTDGTVVGDDAYLMEKGTDKPLLSDHNRSRSGSAKGKALFGLGGAAVGAAAMHHHNRSKSISSEDVHPAMRQEHGIDRKPLAGGATTHTEPWSPEPPPPMHEPGVIAGNSTRQSFDSARSRPSRDVARANELFNNHHAPTSGTEHSTAPGALPTDTGHHDNHHGLGTAAAAAGAGALGGAAISHHRHNKDDRLSHLDSAPQYENIPASHYGTLPTSHHDTLSTSHHDTLPTSHHDTLPASHHGEHNSTGTGMDYSTPIGTQSNVGHHNGHHGLGMAAGAAGAGAIGGAAIAHHRHSKDNRVSNSDSISQHDTLLASHHDDSNSSGTSSSQYSDALPTHAPPAAIHTRQAGLHELPTDVPPTPTTQARRQSALGAAAPAAAVGSYFTTSHPDHPRSRSNSAHNRRSDSAHNRSRSRSSSRARPHSFPDHPDDYAAYYPTMNPHDMPPIPSRSPRRRSRVSSEFEAGNGGRYPIDNDRPPSPPYLPKSIVGDNGYPHMGVPRRRSGGAYDYAQNGGMGPQAVPRPPPVPLADENGVGSGNSSNGAVTSDEDGASWRLSHGMPGGWSRGPPMGQKRFYQENLGSPVSPVGSEVYTNGGNGGRMRKSLQGNGRYDPGVGQAM